MGRLISPSRYRVFIIQLPRTGLVIRLGGILLLLLTLQFIHLHHASRQAVQAKYTTTDFGTVNWDTSITDKQLELRHDLLAARVQWKQLGSGFEGTTYVWDRHVIKNFHPARSPFRNCVIPSEISAQAHVETQNRRWPTEIAASLVLGGQEGHVEQGNDGFLPVTDFFLASTSQESMPEWHLVTPLVAGGDLLSLAKRIREANEYETYRDMDVHFRPAFHKLLSALHNMHDRGLCHDDVKPGNIFVGNDVEWFVGDMGNVRELTHPYHTSRIWRLNSQLPDCRANDVLRMVKTYMQFLRASSRDNAVFDLALFEGKEPWSRLFWMSMEANLELSASRVLQWSQTAERAEAAAHYLSKYEQSPPGLWNVFARAWLGKQRIVQRAVDDILLVRVSEGWTRVMALSSWFGVPVGQCPALPQPEDVVG